MAAGEQEPGSEKAWSDTGVFDDPALLAAADERALADISAGRLVTQEAVKRWLATWGSDDPWDALRWR